MDIQKSKLNFWYDLFKKTLFMHLLVLAIFGKYVITYEKYFFREYKV